MEELVRHLGVDWKLLLAQVVNFTILLIVLRKFAYGPILNMLRERKRSIEEGIRMRAEAEERLRVVDRIKEEKLTAAKVEAVGIVNRAEQTAHARQEEIARETDRKVESIIADARRVIESEKAKMRDGLYADSEELLREGIARVLGKMQPDERDNRLIREALRELKSENI